MKKTGGVTIIGKKGSKAVSQVVRLTDVTRYTSRCSLVVNYGLAGPRYAAFLKKHPSLAKKPVLNKYIGKNKFDVLQDVKAADIVDVPESFKRLPKNARVKDFLVKKYHSQGGVGIAMAKSKTPTAGKYYQKFVSNRKYELRVHGFLWAPKEDWLVQKRFGAQDAIAWNFHQGGRFQTVKYPIDYPLFRKAMEITEAILQLRKMAFGAVDFIVTADQRLLFLEVNSAPGFTEISQHAYIKTFNKLCRLSQAKVRELVH
jgi:glutathione synthase/RimK-type ligase-like ATP-grasp enzyme